MSVSETLRIPPKRRPGQGCGPRRIDGLALGVREAAVLTGESEKSLYGQVSRRTIPFRRKSGRIVFLRAELEQWLSALPGCTIDEAMKNVKQRTEASG